MHCDIYRADIEIELDLSLKTGVNCALGTRKLEFVKPFTYIKYKLSFLILD